MEEDGITPKMDLEGLRDRIDEVDDEMLELMERRFKLARKAGEIKRQGNQPIYNPQREREVLERLTDKTVLDEDFVRKIFGKIIEYCRENE